MGSGEDIDRLCEEEGLPGALKTPYPHSDPSKGVFCSRTLNLRSIQVIWRNPKNDSAAFLSVCSSYAARFHKMIGVR